MNILRVIASVDPKGGGPIEGLKSSAFEMSTLGHTTEVVTFDDPEGISAEALPFPVHACGPGLGRYGYTGKLPQWIAENGRRFDVAIVEGLWNHASVGGWSGLTKSGLPYVIFTHGMMDPWFKKTYPLKHLLKQIFWTAFQGKALRDAHAVLFTCEEEKDLSRNVFRGPSYQERVVGFGTVDAPPASAQQRNAFRAKVPSLAGRPYILFLSRIHRKKGCDLLVEAFANLARNHPDIDLVIAGPDQEGLKAGLETTAQALGLAGRLHWPGMLTGDAKWGAFHGAEAFILPSHQENFGIVVAEAMACSTPVLISNKVNIWQEVKESGGGLVEEDTIEGTRNLLTRWFSLSAECKDRMKLSARRGFERHFHISAATRNLVQVLEEAAARREVR